ncbi:hypothetical protein Bbelb_120460 [Branchiostoma belcheri]|nr:hypothetical protein Bbelb_120460 [Branchiostoma belcheri]
MAANITFQAIKYHIPGLMSLVGPCELFSHSDIPLQSLISYQVSLQPLQEPPEASRAIRPPDKPQESLLSYPPCHRTPILQPIKCHIPGLMCPRGFARTPDLQLLCLQEAQLTGASSVAAQSGPPKKPAPATPPKTYWGDGIVGIVPSETLHWHLLQTSYVNFQASPPRYSPSDPGETRPPSSSTCDPGENAKHFLTHVSKRGAAFPMWPPANEAVIYKSQYLSTPVHTSAQPSRVRWQTLDCHRVFPAPGNEPGEPPRVSARTKAPDNVKPRINTALFA